MSAPVIPIGRRICVDCAANIAKPGRRRCELCLGGFSRPIRFVGTPAKSFVPAGYAQPRIVEVPLPNSREADAYARRFAAIVGWAGLALMVVFVAGFLFGRCAR
jgi:hypothetical protein